MKPNFNISENGITYNSYIGIVKSVKSGYVLSEQEQELINLNKSIKHCYPIPLGVECEDIIELKDGFINCSFNGVFFKVYPTFVALFTKGFLNKSVFDLVSRAFSYNKKKLEQSELNLLMYATQEYLSVSFKAFSK